MNGNKIIHFKDINSLSKSGPQDIEDVDFNQIEIDLMKDMEDAAIEIRALGVECIVHSGYHLKIEHVNYYPKTGSINIDRRKKFKAKGFESLKRVLAKEGLI